MADDIVIRAEGLGKKYIIGHEAERERYVALRDVVARGARNAWRMARDMARGRIVVPGDTVEEFWALKDINFEVRRGEVLGIIGRNGAGKSTLLKILSRITEPTEGRVTIRGRVASLLEVGTGFHPELTGRENIFLNGAVLGMKRAEIKRKFDEIVAFAGVEKFLDTPVKRYSSGMYVRLAFAVAAHLDPEILIVDEVLSVGDAEFQRKCLGKMQDVASHGRTVLLVSHNMSAVNMLSSKGMCLANGRVLIEGNIASVMSGYLSSTCQDSSEWHISKTDQSAVRHKAVFFTAAAVVRKNGDPASQVPVSEAFDIRIEFEMPSPALGAELVARVETSEGVPVFSSVHAIQKAKNGLFADIRYVEVPAMFLMPGSYFLTLAAQTPMVEVYDHRQRVLNFEILDTATTLARHRNYKEIGVVLVDLPWRLTSNA